MKEEEKKIPFEIDRNQATSLVGQIVAGFRRAFETEYYKTGDELPSLRDLSAKLGVSMIVVRAAYAELAKEGLVSKRRGSGCRAVGKEAKLWRGTVLVVGFGHGEHFVSNAIQSVLRARLLEAGYFVTVVQAHVASSEANGIRQLEYMLRQRFDLIIALCDEQPVIERLLRTGDRLIVFHNYDMELPKDVTQVHFNDAYCIWDFVRHCNRAGVRRVTEVGLNPKFATAAEQLENSEIEVSRLWVRPEREGAGVIENVMRRTQELFAKKLERGREWLPDVFYFTDDYVATAALMTLMRAGVRIPEDVRVVSWSNRGLGPVFPISLTRMEFDPYDAGELMGELALEMLEGRLLGEKRGKRKKKLPPRTSALKLAVAPKYVIGETFPERRWEIIE